MRSFRFLTFIMMALVLFFSNCKKDKEVPAVENEDVSDLIVCAFETDEYGIDSQLDQAALLFEGYLAPQWCGTSGDSTLNTHYDGQEVEYQYDIVWNYKINCSGSTPSVVNIGNHCSGTCNTSVLSNNFNSSVSWTVLGMTSSFSEYVFNGSYSQSGTFTSKLREKHSFSDELSVTFTDIRMSKSTHVVSSGTADITVKCTTSEGEEFNFSGTLVFNGNENCTLTLDGTTYTIQL